MKAFFYLSVSPARRAPLSPQALFNGLYTPFGSPVPGGQKPQEREDVTALSAVYAPPVFNSLYDPFGSPCRGQKPQREGPYPIPKP